MFTNVGKIFKVVFKNKPHNEFSDNLKYPTPFFYTYKEKIISNLRNYEKCFPGALIHYAMKANFEKEVLQTIYNAGGQFEVASIYELKMLKDIGVSGEKIIYGTSAKPEMGIKTFFDYGVDRFAFDCFSELEKIAKFAPGSKVYLRVKVEDNKSVFKLSEKFGTEKENIVMLLKQAKELGLQPYGISFNVGSQCSDPLAWANGIKDISQSIVELMDSGITLEVINLGGGFPCNTYLTSETEMSLSLIAQTIFTELDKLPYQPKIILEPGRGIIADAVLLVVSIFAKAKRKDIIWLFLDAGVYTGFFESMAYQGSTRYRITPLNKAENIEEAPFALAGPTGDSPDVITREIFLPKDIGIGDKLIVHDIGAYSLPTITNFHGFPKPPIYYI